MKAPVLYIFSGLPGVGKTTLSQKLASRLEAVHLRIDTIEQALRDLCGITVYGEGYGVAYRIAADNLRLGQSVVTDSCNPIELTRRKWEDVARECQVSSVNIEIICSDAEEHRQRVETRKGSVPGLKLPAWEDVLNREYDSWIRDRVVIDTAKKNEKSCLHELLSKLGHEVS